MTDINLLPWRERLHQKAKKQWLMGLSMVLGLSLFILILTCGMLNSKIHRTIEINERLKDPLKDLSAKLKRIQMIEYKKMEVAVKTEAFQTLQQEQLNTMAVLRELVNQMPSRMYLTGLRKQDRQWTLEGVAESFLQVSIFVQQLARIAKVKDPKWLKVDASDRRKDDGQHHFIITF